MIPRPLSVLYYAICLLALAGFAVPMFRTAHLFDDAYMFWRYAGNLLDGNGFSWNPENGSVYGATSLFYLLVVSAFSMLIKSPELLLILCSSLGCILALFALWKLPVRSGVSEAHNEWWFRWFFVALAAGILQPLVFHAFSGMDTTWAVAAAAGLLFCWLRWEKNPSQRFAVQAGMAGALLWLIRPELVLLAFTIPLTLLILVPDKRKQILISLAAGVVMLALILLVCHLIFGSALPLSFYIKGTEYYDAAFLSKYKGKGAMELFTFFGRMLPAWGVVIAGVWAARKTGAVRRPLAAAALAATVLHIIYITFFVTQVMGEGKRFYLPVVPLLLFAAIVQWRKVTEYLASKELNSVSRNLLLGSLAWLAANAADSGMKIYMNVQESPAYNVFSTQEVYRVRFKTYWASLDSLSTLPDDFAFASTEVGMIAAMNPHKHITDLSGLNEADLAKRRTTAAKLLASRKPDLIYLPHVDYAGLNAEISSDSALQSLYTTLSGERIRGFMGAAVLKESPYYNRVMSILDTSAVAP